MRVSLERESERARERQRERERERYTSKSDIERSGSLFVHRNSGIRGFSATSKLSSRREFVGSRVVRKKSESGARWPRETRSRSRHRSPFSHSRAGSSSAYR